MWRTSPWPRVSRVEQGRTWRPHHSVSCYCVREFLALFTNSSLLRAGVITASDGLKRTGVAKPKSPHSSSESPAQSSSRLNVEWRQGIRTDWTAQEVRYSALRSARQ